MESNNQQSSFWQFSDQLRLHTSTFSDLSLNDSIWSVNNPTYATKRPECRRNFDIRVGGDISGSELKHHQNNTTLIINNNNINLNADFKSFNDGWKVGSGQGNMGMNLNGGFNKEIYSKPSNKNNNSNHNHQYLNNFDLGVKESKNFAYKGEDEQINLGKVGRKNKEVKRENNGKDKNGENKSGVDKRFKTLPATEALPKNETVGGYIFVCNNDTMEENLKRQLFGLPPRYRDSVRQITPGLPLFLYNYSTHQLHGIYEAASFGGTNIDPKAWQDKKNPAESRFPAQVRVQTRKLCEPLDEDAFRPILHHYDGPKFRLELSVPEALSLLDIFAESNA